ncbi:hypothetical protein PanWU01x14_021410, partial [Parasponia andersonii]
VFGNKIGKVIEDEKDDDISCVGRFLRVCIEVDISRSLRQRANV